MQTQAIGALRHGIPFAEYQGRRSLNISALKNIGRSPLYYRYRLDHPMQPTAAMELGTATHEAVLEPDRFALDYVVWDGGRRWLVFPLPASSSSSAWSASAQHLP